MNLVSHSKKRGLIIIILTSIFLIALVLIYNTYSTNKRYKEYAVMAQAYLEAESYEEAIAEYIKAMAMKNGDKELLTLGLAQAYVGIHDYDKALEVLRNRYQVSGTIVVKEKIEEITAEKSDYEFNQMISYGDTYFSNGEFNKAIAEYEKAKLVKSREDTSFVKIAKSYMELEKYDLAKEEILEGLALMESVRLEVLQANVENKLKILQYEGVLSKASEYINQENYEDALNQFNEAIWLMPDVDTAYNQMAELYILMEDYYTAKYLIQNYLRSHNSEASEETLEKANRLIVQREKKEELLNELYTALNMIDINTIIKILSEPLYTEDITKSAPLYYNPLGDMDTSFGYGMYIADKDNIYVGGFKDKMKEGIGVQFIYLEGKEEDEYYYYQGEWNHNSPNGMGKTSEQIHSLDRDGNKYIRTTITSGLFTYGLESGGMQKTFFENGEEKGRVNYMVVDGRPDPLIDLNGLPVQAEASNRYVIGEIYLNNESTGKYYSVKNGSILKVKHINE